MLPDLRIYTTVQDIKYILVEHEEVISDVIRRDGVWGKEYLDLSAKILRNSPAGRVVDVGASFGTWTVPLALMFNDKHVFESFEPLPKVNMQLGANVLLNNLDNVNVHKFALGEKTQLIEDAALDFDCSANHGAHSFNHEYDSYRGVVRTNDKNDLYEFRKLDDFRYADVRLVKITTPAMEGKVMNGMLETITLNNHPPILFESWGNVDWYASERKSVISFLESKGYLHFHEVKDFVHDHIIAFKSKEDEDRLLGDSPATSSSTSSFTTVKTISKASSSTFEVSETEQKTDDVLKNQIGGSPV
jgi:FkbM family methyltransferase